MTNGHRISSSVRLFASLSSVAALVACGQKPEAIPTAQAQALPASTPRPTVVWPVIARPKAIGPRLVLQGKLEFHDGDTIYTHNGDEKKGYRLWGADALELGQSCRLGAEEIKCGSETRKAFLELVRGQEIACEKMDEDKRKDNDGKIIIRDVSICYVNGAELNAEMVGLGWALDFSKYTKGHYLPLQQDAQAEKRGIGAYDAFQKSWDYRLALYKKAAKAAAAKRAAEKARAP